MPSKCDSLYIPFLSCDLSMKGPISVALCPFNVGLSSLGSSTCGILRAQQLTRDDLVKTGLSMKDCNAVMCQSYGIKHSGT